MKVHSVETDKSRTHCGKVWAGIKVTADPDKATCKKCKQAVKRQNRETS